jgi:chaperonin cofactor prefoldin
MKGVKIKQAKYFMQVIKQNQLPYLLKEEKEVFDTVYKAIRDNKLFNDVGNIIEKEANRIVNEECKPEWERISEEITKLNDERNELDKKEDRTEEENDRIKEIGDKISELSSESEKV